MKFFSWNPNKTGIICSGEQSQVLFFVDVSGQFSEVNMSFVYSELKVGDSNNFQKTITVADITLFAAISGDFNPMHVSAQFAKKTQYKQRIAHGALTSGLISAVIANTFPASIYISQYVEYLAPVFIDDTITAIIVCKEKLGKGRVRLQTKCINQNDVLVVDGEAIVRLARDR